MFSFPSHQFHQLSVTYITDIPNFLPDEVGEVMRSVCWGQTVDSGATGASNLVMQPLGPRGSLLKHEVQDSENLNKTDTRNMENLLGKFYVLIKCCICKRSVYAASGLNTALHTEPVYSCVGYSSLHCIELWTLVPRLVSRLLNLVFSTPHCTASSTLQQCNKRVFQEIFARDAQYFFAVQCSC